MERTNASDLQRRQNIGKFNKKACRTNKPEQAASKSLNPSPLGDAWSNCREGQEEGV